MTYVIYYRPALWARYSLLADACQSVVRHVVRPVVISRKLSKIL